MTPIRSLRLLFHLARIAAVATFSLILRAVRQIDELSLQRVFDERLAKVFEEVFYFAGRLFAGRKPIGQLWVD
jgi:hypothetical protein